MDKKIYSSSIRSHRKIQEAFLELLSEKELEKITIADIAKRAEISRSTFYIHYPDIYGVVEEIQEEIINETILIIRQLKQRDVLEAPLSCLQSISDVLKRNLAFYKRLGHTEQMHLYLDKYRSAIAESLMNDIDIPEEIRFSSCFYIQVYFFLGGIMNTYQQWAEGNAKCSLEEMENEIAEIIASCSYSIINENWLK